MSEQATDRWKSIRLKHFAKARRGTTYIASELSEDSVSYPLYINMKSFRVGGGYSANGDKFYTSPYTQTQLLQPNDLLIANTDVTASCDILGAPIYLPEKKLKKGVLFSHHVTALSLSKGIDKLFLFYLFCLDKNRVRMQSYGRGTTVKMLDSKEFSNLLLIIPPPPEQKKIASILTSVDEVIENTQKQIDKLQDLKKATMNELLTKGLGHTEFKDSELGRIPKSWETIKLDDFCVRVTDGTHDSPIRTSEGYRLVTSKNLKSGRLDLTDTYTISVDDYREIEKRSRVDINDILFGMIGTVGNPVIVSSYDLPFAIKNVALLKFDGDVSKSRWSFFYLDSELLRQRIKNDQTGSTQNFVGLGYMRNLRIPVPPTSEMKGIVSIAEGIASHLDNLQVKLLALKSLKKSLMQDLLTGKVRVRVN